MSDRIAILLSPHQLEVIGYALSEVPGKYSIIHPIIKEIAAQCDAYKAAQQPAPQKAEGATNAI